MLVKWLKFLLVIFCAMFKCADVDAATKYDIDAVRQYRETRNTNIEFVEACDSNKGKCVDDVFADTNVQMKNAIPLAQEYGLIKYKQELICSPSYRTAWNDDYIKCTDVSGKNFYEFKFDDVKESFDDTIKQSIGRALCQIHGGKMPNDDNLCVLSNCNSLDKSLKKFSFSSEFLNIMGGSYGCKINFETKYADIDNIRTAFGIDSKKFLNLQIQSGADLDFLLKRYVQRHMDEQGIKLTSFSCADAFNTYRNEDVTNLKDDLLTCSVNGKEVDFLFDDANESIDFSANVGLSGLKCIADSGGTYDGKNCHGLDKKQCSALGAKVKGGTRWDNTLDTCVLNNASAAEDAKSAASIALSVSIGIVAVATTGGAAMIVFAVAGSTGAVAKKTATEMTDRDMREFLASSAKCKSSGCAEKTLKTFINDISSRYDDIDGQLLSAIDDELARLINLVPDNAEMFTNAVNQSTNQKLQLSNFNKWSPAEKLNFAGNVLLTIGAASGVATVAKTGWTKLVGMLKQAPKQPKVVSNIVVKARKTIKNVTEAGGAVDDALDMVSASMEVADAI